MTSTRVPTQAACSFSAATQSSLPSQSSLPPSPPASPPLPPRSHSLKPLRDDDDTRRNRWMLRSWHDTQSRHPIRSDPGFIVAFRHSASSDKWKGPFTGEWEKSARRALDWQACWESKGRSSSYLISSRQWCTFSLLTCFLFLKGPRIS